MKLKQLNLSSIKIMTVLEFHPRFNNKNDWSCASTDKTSPWCLAISDCIWHHLARFYEYQQFVKYCDWPNDNKGLVEYIDSPECCYYSLVETDGTLLFAYQNNDYIFITYIKSESYRVNSDTPEGFGCIINKLTNEIHCVSLGEDDGNYWGDHDIEISQLNQFDIGVITSIINDMNSKLFWNKDELIEKLYNLAK